MRTNRNNTPTGTCNKCNDEKPGVANNSGSMSCNDNNMDLNNLIMWNVSKALEKNPCLNLKNDLTAAQEHLDQKLRGGNMAISNCPTEQQHLVYALLAWQQLGHRDAESLFQFIESKKKKENKEELIGCKTNDIKLNTNSLTVSSVNIQSKSFTNSSRNIGSICGSGTCMSGPVVKLPVDTKIIMRLDNIPCQKPPSKTTNLTDTKLKSACCMDSACAENLAAMDKATQELRVRATSLAKREAERVELLERAETAWADLELGYQRRLRLANEKKDDLTRQIQKGVKDRNEFKEECGVLANELKRKGELAEQQRVELRELQKVVCQRACRRLALSEEASRGEAALAEEQCKMVQLDRDLQFKEEQTRRKLTLIENETESACALMHDAERALRAELSGLRDQIKQVSDQLLEEDILSNRIKGELEVLRKEKEGLVEDLDSCKELCDNKMQELIDEALSKKEELEELKQKVMECRCKYPVDVEVEAKRTPSLAALCKCAPEDRLLESCSCTSLRSTLISSLLADLFGGLQSELTGAGLQMPCQLMKCLEDKHNWDRASVVKTNLRNFFTKLLVGELDIAIASAIENYHAKWIGASCADGPKLVPKFNDDSNEGWETRALECRAQQLATRLAEQLFEERAEELTKRAKEIVTMGPPPCECKSFEAKISSTKVMPCLVTPLTPFKRSQGPSYESQRDSLSSPATNNWKRTSQDVTELKHQVKALKKETIKKEDLREMEENIAKIIKQVTEPEKEAFVSDNKKLPKDNHNIPTKVKRKEIKNIGNNNTNEIPKTLLGNRIIKKKPLPETGIPRKCFPHDKPPKQSKKYNYSQEYSINLCLCGQQGTKKPLPSAQSDADTQFSLIQKSFENIVCEEVSDKIIKPTIPKLLQPNCDSNTADVSKCIIDCKCLQKKPSTKSIDQLLNKLAKWKCDLHDPNRKFLNESKCNLSSKCLLNMALNNEIYTKSPNDSNADFPLKNLQEQVSNNHHKMLKRRNENEQINLSANMCLAANTESVYMADVNLDKSNEFSDKYMGTTDSMKRPEIKEEISKQCFIKKSIKEEPKQGKNRSSYKDVHKMIAANTHKNNNKDNIDLKKISGTDRQRFLTNCKSTNFVVSQNNENKSIIKETVSRTNKNSNEMNKADTVLNDFDYYINFLGVTLADAEYTKMAIEDDQNKNMILIEPPHLQNQEPHHIVIPKFIKEKYNQKQNNIDMQYKAEKGEDNPALSEFEKLIMKILIDQLKQKTKEQKDIALDSQSFEHKNNSSNNCACCSSLKDTIIDLEVNTFDLLDNHLKEKLNEFKKYTCKSSCIAPEEAEKIFTKILKKVKQVISDCANAAKGNEGVVLPNDGSWKRVYGLLQEYLKAKLKRIKCLPFVNNDKDGILPHVLENVSNLIEQDFQRLKDLCKCKKNNSAHTKHVLSIYEELPKKDINITKDSYCNTIFKPLSILNPYPPAIFINNTSSQVTPNLEPIIEACDAVAETNSVSTLLRQNESSQVPPNLGMVTKSCDVIDIDDQSKEITEINLSSLSKPAEQFIYNDCNCNVNKTKASRSIYELLGKKDVLVNLYADVLINSNCISPDKHILHNLTDHVCYKSIVISKSLPDFGILDNIKKNIVVNKRDINHTTESTAIPLVGCTIECSCDSNFTSHACKKTVIQDYNRISNNWIQLIDKNKKNIKDLSYIMNGSLNNNKNSVKSSMIDTMICGPTSTKEEEDNTCATETNLDSDDEIILIRYDEKSNNSHHMTTNTFDENGSFIGDCESTLSQHWYECKSNKSEIRSITHKFSNSHIHNTIDKTVKYSKSDATVCTDNCHCSKVPICHVKMLVNHIEKNVMNSQCTCDVMSTVCPVHF